jgi:hypothetical protein
MAVDMAELLALPLEERIKIAEALVEGAVPPDFGPLLKELASGLRHTNQMLETTLSRFEHFDEEIERNRAEVREEVLRSGETWPFPFPAKPQ